MNENALSGKVENIDKNISISQIHRFSSIENSRLLEYVRMLSGKERARHENCNFSHKFSAILHLDSDFN